MHITIELTVGDALFVLGHETERALENERLAAECTGEEREILLLAARSSMRVSAKLVKALYPNDLDAPIIAAVA